MPKPAGEWSEIQIAGHPCHIYVPPSPSPHGYVAMYLHGLHLGVLEQHPIFAELFDSYGLRCIAPVTKRSWWTDRICAEFDPHLSAERYVLDHVMPWLAEQWGAAPPRVGLFGASMGGQGALRLAYKHPNVFPVVAGMSPVIDYHIRMAEGDETLPLMYRDAEQARQDTALLHIHPLNWPRHQWFCCAPDDYRWFDSVDRLRMKLYSLGVPFECDLETPGGHGWTYYEKMAQPTIRFLFERLERERMRII